MKSLIAENDKYKMNWIQGATEWGTVKAPKTLQVQRVFCQHKDYFVERYTFTNISKLPVFTSLKEIAIYTPFNDDYCGSDVCIHKRCHTHIWCGGNISYIMALRMGGEAPHLGLVLTKGSLEGYSVERDLSRKSNDRGDFLLHPTPQELDPGESFVIEWKLFWHNGKADFYRKLSVLQPRFIEVRAEQYIVFEGETTGIEITPKFSFTSDSVHITVEDQEIPFTIEKGKILIKNKETDIKQYGERVYHICVEEIETILRIMILPPFLEVVKRRCHFIVEKQQFHRKGSPLDGAYLIYDKEESHTYYSPEYDYNGGRERIGMGILIACFLKVTPDKELEKSLRKYTDYIEREIYNEKAHKVTNDIEYNDTYKRLYNYPWVAVFYLELYELWQKDSFLTKAYQIIQAFYEQGGEQFYAIELPLERILTELDKANRKDEYKELLTYFRKHGDTILKNDILYPAHEVNFEQSIVAPATQVLMQLYFVTGEEQYKSGAIRQMQVLELFSGTQPDYHLYEVAIRHWDGYWFGKRKQFGDTFPHYWSALTGNAYMEYARMTGEEQCYKKSEASLRGVLSLFFPDGSASCAYVYPVQVNGEDAQRFDAYANDQDWGLYFYLRQQTNRHYSHRAKTI
ncbi:MAG: six-hairpin glycosidase [bacterium]|nr:six-hairpin glycosidase [bacterium]